jgi:hypothetical protein
MLRLCGVEVGCAGWYASMRARARCTTHRQPTRLLADGAREREAAQPDLHLKSLLWVLIIAMS